MPLIDPLMTFPGYVARRLSAATIGEVTRRLAPLGVRPVEASVLLCVRANAGATQSEIARLLDIQRANMAPLVGRLEERGLVAREDKDGRSQALVLTAEGQELADASLAEIAAYERELVARVPEELRAQVLPVLLALWSPAQIPQKG